MHRSTRSKSKYSGNGVKGKSFALSPIRVRHPDSSILIWNGGAEKEGKFLTHHLFIACPDISFLGTKMPATPSKVNLLLISEPKRYLIYLRRKISPRKGKFYMLVRIYNLKWC